MTLAVSFFFLLRALYSKSFLASNHFELEFNLFNYLLKLLME